MCYTVVTMQLSSSAFAHEGLIPSLYTCDEQNSHPPLTFSDVPVGTVSLALTMHDPDVPKQFREDGNWDHWLVWNMPPETRALEAGTQAPGVTGMNTGGTLSYQGPCPPNGEHRYFFTLYALDALLDLEKNSASKQDLLNAMDGHILAQAQIMGRYKRQEHS